MEDSFVCYRNTTVDSEDSDVDFIDTSQQSIALSNKKSCGKNSQLLNVFIAESDYDSTDKSDDADESMIIKPKTNRVLRLNSDSESEIEDNVNLVQLVKNETSVQSIDNEPSHLSAATRLSIFGIKPSDNASDDSDFIESDNEENNSSNSSTDASEMHPNPYIGQTSCPSPNRPMDLSFSNDSPMKCTEVSFSNMDISFAKETKKSPLKDTDLPVSNESIELIEKDTDIVCLSSDDGIQEVEMSTPKVKDRSIRKSNLHVSSLLMYVSKQTKHNAIRELDSLRSEYSRLDGLLKSTNLERLPDNGVKLVERYSMLQIKLKKQNEKVANMIEEPENPTIEQIKNDEFISWEQLHDASKAVKPKTFGTQALNTHMSQQILTMDRLQALHSSLGTRPADDAIAESPKGLVTELMQHQLHALAWLSWRETQQPRGGILADDMGLGKTLTMISLILNSKEKNLDDIDKGDESDDQDWAGKSSAKLTIGGTLVVCPASLLSQWHNEIQNHCKRHSLRDEIHHGNKRETKTYHLARNDVVITTYNIVQRDAEKNGVLMRIRWKRVILDEAHVVRNHKSLTATAIFKLSAHFRWCLTGTPVHNKDLDLFSLLKFLRCSPFDNIVLWKKWIDNKSTGGQERLATVMKTLMLRRTKQQLQEQKSLQSLPDKSQHYIEVDLSKNEMIVYQKVLVFSKTLFAQFLHQRAEKQSIHGGTVHTKQQRDEYYRMHEKMVALKGLKQVKSHEILVLLLRLRQICCHPGLIHAMLEDEDDDLNKSECREEVEIAMLDELSKLNIEEELEDNKDSKSKTNDEGLSVSSAIKQVLHISNPVFNLKNGSAKIKAVLKCLQENVFIHKNDKAIVVSQWTSMLDIFFNNLKAMGIKTTTLSGKVPVSARHEIIKQINDPNSEVKVLLLSLCAGGVGLNLVGANHLLLTDLHWNPQLEAQAQDRIYRVGQKKPVHIYKFVCRETVEQTIKLLQDKKLNLANNILTGVKMVQSSKLSIDDLKLMFNMH